MALIRYPGSKAKLAAEIMARFPYSLTAGLFATKMEYREPFFGCGAVGFQVMSLMPPEAKVWLNDKDYWIVCLWQSVMKDAKSLCKLIREFKPSADLFYEFKEQDGCKNVEPVIAGFRKLACHQMSISGFGVMSGGPLGGRDQANAAYPVDCRWNPSRLRAAVLECNRLLTRFKAPIQFTCRDFSEVLANSHSNCFVYADPPYVKAGPALYKHSLDDMDHERLAAGMKSLKGPWILSYDDHELVRQLYSDCLIENVDITYTNATHAAGKRPKNSEVVIQPLAA